jgi:hypothetical protein
MHGERRASQRSAVSVPSCLVWWRALIGVALASAIWLYGTWVVPGTGLDGPCAGYGEFPQDVREGSSGGGDWSWLPPREICVEERLDGTRREAAYPGSVTFAFAGAAFLVPFLVRPWDRVGGPSRAGAMGIWSRR